MAEASPNARLEAFCDGVFAIALTLLIIDIKIPSDTEIHDTASLWQAIRHILPSILAFVLSFVIILITWVNHHNALKLAQKSSPAFIYANGLLLLSVVFTPFPTSLIGEYILTGQAAPAVMLYTGVLILQSLGWALICSAALKDHLLRNERAVAETRKNRIYAYYSVLGYSFLTILSYWFPLPVFVLTILLWVVWLLVGINIRHSEDTVLP